MDSRIHVHVYSLILPSLKRDLNVDAGSNIADILKHIGLPEHATPYLTVALSGFMVHTEAWRQVRPKAGSHLSVGVMPAGDGQGISKDMLRTTAILAGIVGGYLIPGALGLGVIGTGILQAALTYGGFWLATTLIPYQNKRETANNQLTSARNQARQYGVIPKTYGRMRIFPPLAAAPQTEIRGNDHYIQLLMVVGYKPTYVDVSTMKIGETPITEFDGIIYEVNDGWHNQTQITLFSGDIDEQLMDQRVAYAHTWRIDADGAPIVPTPSQDSFPSPGTVTLTTPSNTARIDLDFTFPDGLGKYIGESRETLEPYEVELQIQYRPAGSILESAWISHLPSGKDRPQVFYQEAKKASRATCVAWIVELTAMIGDLIDAANTYPAAWMNAPQAIYDAVYDAAYATKTLIPGQYAGLTYILGEEAVLTSLTTQVDRLLDLCQRVLAEIDPSVTDYNKEFLSAFSAIANPMLATQWVVAVRRAMGNNDTLPIENATLGRLVDVSQNVPEVFQTIATEFFAFAPTDVRAGIVRRNVSFLVPEGKWEVRIRKHTEDHDDDGRFLDEVYITAFRSHRTKPIMSANMLDKLALIAVEVLATDQLSGSLDQFSVEVEHPIRYTEDGVTWLGPALVDGSGNNVSRSPAWIMADIATQPPNYKPVPFSKIDGPNLLEFATWCLENDFHFDYTFDQRATAWRAMEDACKAAKAAPTMRDGKYAVIHDKPQAIPRGMITITNASRFEFGKTMQDRAQALRIKFKNPAKDWADDEIYVYDDGFGDEGKLVYHTEVVRAVSATSLAMVALYQDVTSIYDIGDAVFLSVNNYSTGVNAAKTRTVITPRSSPYNFRDGGNYKIMGHVITTIPARVEEISIPGLVDVPGDPAHAYNSNQVYKLGRYLLAVAKLRPEIFKATLDIEQIVFERGDRVEVQMDTVLWGLGSSRVRSLTRVVGGPNAGKVETVTLEQDLFLTDATSYAVRFRNSQNGITGESTFTYAEAEPNTITLDVPLNDSAVPMIKGDLVAWGEPSKSTISCLVQEIRNQRDHSAEVTMIQYSPGVFVAEDGTIPEFDPGISIPPNPERGKPPRPSIVKVTTDESVLERDVDGSFASRIVIDINLPQGRTPAERDAAARVDAIHVQFRRALTAPSLYYPEWVRSGVYARDVTRASIRDVEDGNYYDVRIRAVTKEGVGSDWAEKQSVLVEGKLTPPPDVENLQWLDDKLVWEYPNPPFDHAGYLVRYVQGKGGKWGDAVPAHAGRLLVPQLATEFSYEADRAYMVKAVDTSGVESINAVQVTRFGANVPGVFEVRRTTGTISGDAFTLVGDTYERNADVGSQALDPFYKGRKTDPFYAGAAEAFYHREYRFLDMILAAGSWVSGTPAGATARWLPLTQIVEAPPYVVEGYAQAIPLWPASLDDNLWPASLSENFWPGYFGYEPLRPDGVPHIADIEAPDGITAWFMARFPSSNTQTKIKDIGAVLLVPLRQERVHDFEATTTTPGTGDLVSVQSVFVNIVSVQATLRDDAAGGAVRIVKGATTVEVFIYDAAGARTTGFVDLTIEGY